MSIPVIEQAKIQAQVLVPLVKALQAELGEERASSLVRKALGDVYRRHGEEFWRMKNEKNLGKIMASAFTTFARGDALDYRVIEQSQDAFEIDVSAGVGFGVGASFGGGGGCGGVEFAGACAGVGHRVGGWAAGGAG